MPRVKHPIHPFGTYFLHGDGKPRQVSVLRVGRPDAPEKVKIRDGVSVYWIDRQALSRSTKPKPQPRPDPLAGVTIKGSTLPWTRR